MKNENKKQSPAPKECESIELIDTQSKIHIDLFLNIKNSVVIVFTKRDVSCLILSLGK